MLKAWKARKKLQDIDLPKKALRFEAMKLGAITNYFIKKYKNKFFTNRKANAKDLPLIPVSSS